MFLTFFALSILEQFHSFESCGTSNQFVGELGLVIWLTIVATIDLLVSILRLIWQVVSRVDQLWSWKTYRSPTYLRSGIEYLWVVLEVVRVRIKVEVEFEQRPTQENSRVYILVRTFLLTMRFVNTNECKARMNPTTSWVNKISFHSQGTSEGHSSEFCQIKATFPHYPNSVFVYIWGCG